MDTILNHISRDLVQADDPRAFVVGLGAYGPVYKITATAQLAGDDEDILLAARDWLTRQGFPSTGREIDYDQHVLIATFEREYHRSEPPFVTVAGLTADKIKVRLEVEVTSLHGKARIALNKPLKSLVAALLSHLTVTFKAGPQGDEVIHDPICPPGVPIARNWSGTLLDYSGLATFDEVDDLVRRPSEAVPKALPLGFYAFGAPPGPDPRKLLWLGEFHSGARMEYNGALVVAPQNSGKTELIVRWAVAANRAGYNVLVVDVKGNLHERLAAAGLTGNVWHYATDPEPQSEAHSLNLLADLSCADRTGRHRLAQLTDIVFQLDARDGKNQDWWITQKLTFEAMVLLLKLHEAVGGGAPDFADVFDLASDEDLLVARILGAWRKLPDFSETPDGDLGLDRAFLRFIVGKLAPVIDIDEKRLPEDCPAGQREKRYSYRSVTYGITMALDAFNRYGTLYPRSRGYGDFSLEDLDGDDQCTIVLAAREQDGEIARTLLTMAIKRVEHILYDRRRVAVPARPILLLLDETRRIRGFDASDFITFARDAKAGCVLVYQSLQQIEDEKDRATILENVGTQIYLRSMSGKTAEAFIDLLPKRNRATFTQTTTRGDGRSSSVQTGTQEVPYIGQQELYRLPAGPNPALVFIKDHRSGKPFLVDMTRERIAAAMAEKP